MNKCNTKRSLSLFHFVGLSARLIGSTESSNESDSIFKMLTDFCRLDFPSCHQNSRLSCEEHLLPLQTKHQHPKSSPFQMLPSHIHSQLCAPSLGFQLCHSKMKREKKSNKLIFKFKLKCKFNTSFSTKNHKSISSKLQYSSYYKNKQMSFFFLKTQLLFDDVKKEMEKKFK